MSDPSKPSSNDDPREIWDRRYARVLEHGSTLTYEPWLARWSALLPPGRLVLDLGCGSGHDSAWLWNHGCKVTAAEFSRTALRVAKEAAASIDFVQLDLRHGLPFAPGRYTAVVANLCLHYFSWAQTVEILGQVHACLKPGGALLARFNSTNDSNFGAEGYPQVEPNAFWVDGMYKRYFDLEGLEKLFGEEWQVLGREEMAIHRYGAPKVLWEITATLKT